MLSYGMTALITGYYDDRLGKNLFYYDEGDLSFTLVAAPDGGKRVVFGEGHNLYGPVRVLAQIGYYYPDEDAGVQALRELDASVKATTGKPVFASSFAWLKTLDNMFPEYKPLVRRPAFWTAVGLGGLGVGYGIWYATRKQKGA